MGKEIGSGGDGGGHRHLPAVEHDVVGSFDSAPVDRVLMLLLSGDASSRVRAAKDVRLLAKNSPRHRRDFAGAVGPLVDMLRCGSGEASEAALAALLNIAVKDEINKVNIIKAGALDPIINFLRCEDVILKEHAAAALITLSASSANKPIISASGAIPLLVDIMRNGTSQAKIDSVMALDNLSTHPGNIGIILQAEPIPPLVDLLKSCRKSSRTVEKCTALIESLVGLEDGRTGLLLEEGGILAVVEVLERGSPQSREHAVGALLTMCQMDLSKYREPILREGVIPGLLELTVQGNAKSRGKAQALLRLLRNNRCPRPELQPDTLENIVCSIISQIDGEDQIGKAKQILADMVQVSMEQSLRHLQQRALVCTPCDSSCK